MENQRGIEPLFFTRSFTNRAIEWEAARRSDLIFQFARFERGGSCTFNKKIHNLAFNPG